MRPSRRAVLLFAVLLAACAPAESPPLPTLVLLPTLTPTVDTAPRPLAFWESVTGTLDSDEAAAVWTFSAQAGDAVGLQTRGPVNLALRGPDGATLGAGTAFEVRLPNDGVYTVTVRLAGAAPGQYEIGLSYTDRPNPATFTATPPPVIVGVPTPTPFYQELGTFLGDITPGAPRSEQFGGRTGEPHVFRFEGRAGQFASVLMERTSGTVDPILMLYDPAGMPLAYDDNGAGDRNALLRNIPLRADGMYTLVTTGRAQAGGYRLLLTSGDRPQPVTPTIVARPSATPFDLPLAPTPAALALGSRLQDHAPALGEIDRPGGFGRFSIAAAAGEFLTLGVSPAEGGSLRPNLELFGPLGEQLAMDTAPRAGDEALIAMWPAAEDGVYTALVTGADSTTGAYTISYGSGPSRQDVARGPAAADTPYDGQLPRLALRDVWTLPLTQGDVITAAISPTNDALDPVLELVAPDGSVIASDDNSGGFPNALIQRAQAPITGVYRLRVTAANAVSTGPYRLIWRYLEIAPTPTPDPPRYLLMAANDEVGTGEYRFYPFQGRAGQTIRLRVSAAPGSRLDPVAALLGPDGMVLVEADDSPGTLDAVLIFTIPAEGTYTVRVSGYLSSGPFDLLLDVLL